MVLKNSSMQAQDLIEILSMIIITLFPKMINVSTVVCFTLHNTSSRKQLNNHLHTFVSSVANYTAKIVPDLIPRVLTLYHHQYFL